MATLTAVPVICGVRLSVQVQRVMAKADISRLKREWVRSIPPQHRGRFICRLDLVVPLLDLLRQFPAHPDEMVRRSSRRVISLYPSGPSGLLEFSAREHGARLISG